ncbi:MAG: epimerase [Chlorobiales bacterium]|nr:epimerase [Chlorobiales bacterium]
MKIKVIVFGATGMVGEGVLSETLIHDKVESVLVIGRRSCQVTHPKLKEIVHQDFFDYSSIEGQLEGYDACFFCLGVSSLGMNERDYSRVTYDLTMQAATTLSRLNPTMTFCYVSGTGTDSTEQGRIMWARVKGRTENHLKRLPFKSVYLFRPGLIKPINGQKNVKPLLKILTGLYPLFKILFPGAVCTMSNLGLAMINTVLEGYPKQILENPDIAQLARTTSLSGE